MSFETNPSFNQQLLRDYYEISLDRKNGFLFSLSVLSQIQGFNQNWFHKNGWPGIVLKGIFIQ